MSLGLKIRKFDIYKKMPSDLSQGTNIGGIISLFTVGLILFLIISQLGRFLNPQYKATITSDNYFTRREMMINLDIEFPRFPCEIISLDLQDVMMSHHPNIGSIKKWRLDSNGVMLDNQDFQILREHNVNKQFELARTAFQNNYGCRLIGSFSVKEVPGNFHISSHAYQNIYVRLQLEGLLNQLNVSHVIHDLHFGEYKDISFIKDKHPESVLNKLQNYFKMYNQVGAITSHYHIDIVPTIYQDGYFGQETEAFQYTFNQNTYNVEHMPAVYFNYHIGGLAVQVSPQNSNIFGFLVALCAIVGGTYTIANFLDTILHRMFGSKNQYELIK